MKWFLLLVPIAVLGLVAVFFPSRTDPTVDTPKLTAPCPSTPPKINFRVGIMAAPTIRVKKNLDAESRLAIRQALWPWQGEVAQIAVDLSIWPPSCHRLSVRRRHGGAEVLWRPRGCEKPPESGSLTITQSYGVLDIHTVTDDDPSAKAFHPENEP